MIREWIAAKLASVLTTGATRLNAFAERRRVKRRVRVFPKGTVVRLHQRCEARGKRMDEYERRHARGSWIVDYYVSDVDEFSLRRPDDSEHAYAAPDCMSIVSTAN